MTSLEKPRLRYFEEASGQRHITAEDRYLYARDSARYRACIIGTGTIGQEHMRVATMLGRVAVHGIYDSREGSADIAAEEFAKYSSQMLKRYPDLESACNDPDVDVLFICTPNYSHLEVIEIAARSGKPIFLEKPMATTVADARRIVEIANNHPSFVQVGLQYRYKAPYVEARFEALERNVIGDIKTINMSEYRPPFLDKVDQWNKFSEYSGGTLVEKCCHYFDIMSLFAGSEPESVYATGAQSVNFTSFEKDGKIADIDDSAMVIVHYKNGVRANFTLNMHCPHFYEELVICGTDGRLVASETFDFQRDSGATSNISIELGELGASRKTDVGYTKPIEQSGHHGATFFEHVALTRQLDGTLSDAVTPLEGLWSIIIAAAAQESVETGNSVSIASFIDKHDLRAVLDNEGQP